MECSRAIEKIATALSEYFRKRAPQAAEYIKITGQPEVKVALRAIALYYERDEEVLYLEDLIEALDSKKVFEYLRENLGWGLVEIEGEKYVAIPSRDYLRYISMPREFFRNLLERYCSQYVAL